MDRFRARVYLCLGSIAIPWTKHLISGRELVQRRVVEAFQTELEASKREGYVAPRFDDLDYHLLDGAPREGYVD